MSVPSNCYQLYPSSLPLSTRNDQGHLYDSQGYSTQGWLVSEPYTWILHNVWARWGGWPIRF